jgi:putative transposase
VSPRAESERRDPQFTSIEFSEGLKDANIQINTDGKEAWRDNVLVERLCRSINYEEPYLHAPDRVSVAFSSIARYLTFYNTSRPHRLLGGQMPDKAYDINLQPILVVAQQSPEFAY